MSEGGLDHSLMKDWPVLLWSAYFSGYQILLKGFSQVNENIVSWIMVFASVQQSLNSLQIHAVLII